MIEINRSQLNTLAHLARANGDIHNPDTSIRIETETVIANPGKEGPWKEVRENLVYVTFGNGSRSTIFQNGSCVTLPSVDKDSF